MSITVQNLSKQYGTQNAVDQISFEIEKGQVVGFLGPNGAGKSTTMKILTCFIPQSSGKAYVNGIDTEEDSIAVRKQIGYLPEHNPLYLDMYVKEYLSFIGDVFKVKNKKKCILECIELTGLQLEQRKKIGQLSKGYRQRVGLAQALIHDPSVLILDEPTSGLDPNQVQEIRQLIKELGKEKTVMLSTHQLTEVEAVCDRAIIINHGKIVADKPTKQLKQGLKQELIIEVIFGKTIDPKVLKEISGVDLVTGEGTAYTLRGKPDSLLQEALFAKAVEQKNSIVSLNQRESSLEEVFKSLTAK